MSPQIPATPVHIASAIVGDAWSVLILREACLFGQRRFVGFRDALGLNRATLTSRLGSLTDAGLLERRSVAAGTDRHEYVPTVTAHEYVPVLLHMAEWGRRWMVEPEEGPLLELTHLDCGAPLHAELACSECGEVITPHEVYAERPPHDAVRQVPDVKTRVPRLDQLERARPCPIARCLAATGDRWSVVVIQEAFFGLRHFDEFETRLAIAPNILSNRLGRLTDLGVLRHTPRRNGSRAEYRLTEEGLDLYGVSVTLRHWAMRSLGVADHLHVAHRPCGHDLDVLTRCRACRAPIVAGSVDARAVAPLVTPGT
ncbi:MAG: helix-turn-helix domain-containing protein [Actinomycetota bacterium]|nr:helix-turn-helix domain-containing protein [Actinomycetota bacterium]